jgi:RNA-binding protein 5/10
VTDGEGVWYRQKNYKDTNLREVARQKANNARRGGEEQPKYRDRASERRIMHNQPEAPVVSEKEGGGGKKKHVEVVARAPTPPAAPVNPGEDESNVGNKLLKMMGWKEGTGLGAGGEGRVEPM